jgi:hypothetical protein
LDGRFHGGANFVSGAAKCRDYVLVDWGEYAGSGQYGIVFKDNEGALRFVWGVPCGHEGTPVVDLKVRRLTLEEKLGDCSRNKFSGFISQTE